MRAVAGRDDAVRGLHIVDQWVAILVEGDLISIQLKESVALGGHRGVAAGEVRHPLVAQRHLHEGFGRGPVGAVYSDRVDPVPDIRADVRTGDQHIATVGGEARDGFL